MPTELGTELGTTLGTILGAMEDQGAPLPANIAAIGPAHRYRASQATTSGGNIVSIPNEGAAGGQLNVGDGTLAQPTADAALNNAPSVAFTGTQSLVSSLPTSAFAPYNNGDDFTAVFVASIAVSGMLQAHTFASGALGPGFRQGVTTGVVSGLVNNGASNVVVASASAGGVGANVNRFEMRGAQGSRTYRNGALIAGPVTPTGAFNTAASYVPLMIGRNTAGGFNNNARFAEIILFPRALTTLELTVVDAEIFAAYGAHA